MRISTFALCLSVLAAAPLSADAKDPQRPDQVLSPYFVVLGDDSVGALPLKETKADVHIAGVIAHVRVTQTYHNTGKTPIEAVYVFPGSTRSAVFGMQMTIEDRTIVAQINRKEQARKLYEAAKEEGKSASLLEQHRPNVFQMSVANILPGDEIKVELDYTELLVPEDGYYELVYPAVVGPRYTEATKASAAPGEQWTQNPHVKKGEEAPYRWDIGATVAAGLPIQKIASPSHQITPKFQGEYDAEVKLGGDATFVTHGADNPGNRDFVLRYRLAGGEIESGLLLYRGEKENFFLMMMQPPERVEVAQIPPREYVFIVDVSGSMHGFPIAVSKEVMNQLLSELRPQDRFNIMFFAGGSKVLSNRSLPASSRNVRRAMDLMDAQRGGGSTRLLPALQQALDMPSEGMSRTFVVVTDGYVSVEDEAFELIRNNLGNANLFTFGIGSSVNRHIIEGMARVGMGEPFVALDATQARTQAKKLRKYISSPVLTNVEVEFTEGFQAYDVEPPYIPDVFADRPVIVFGKYKGLATGKIEVNGISGAGDFRDTISVGKAQENPYNEALRYLWARHKIATVADLNQARMSEVAVEEVTLLGLEYSLMTKYTSFVAIDSEIRNVDGKSTTVKQPVPLPAGVENQAVPGRAYSAEMLLAPPAPRIDAESTSRGESISVGGRVRSRRGRDTAIESGADDWGDESGDDAEEWTIAEDPEDPAFGAGFDDGSGAVEKPETEATKGGTGKASGPIAVAKITGVAASKGNERRIRRILERALPQVGSCGDGARAQGKSLAGTGLTVVIKLDRRGRVISVKVTRNSVGGDKIAECLRTTLRNTSFKDVAGRSTTITVHYEYRLE